MEEGLPHGPALLRTPCNCQVAPAGPTKLDSAPSQGQAQQRSFYLKERCKSISCSHLFPSPLGSR